MSSLGQKRISAVQQLGNAFSSCALNSQCAKRKRSLMWVTVRHRIQELSPYAALILLGVPTITVELSKVAAVLFLGGGHWVTGLVVMLCAYAASLFITERLFVLVKPKLMKLRWFKRTWLSLVYVLRNTKLYIQAMWTAAWDVLCGER